MSERTKTSAMRSSRTPVETSIDNMFTDLLQGRESIRAGKKIIKTPDSS